MTFWSFLDKHWESICTLGAAFGVAVFLFADHYAAVALTIWRSRK